MKKLFIWLLVATTTLSANALTKIVLEGNYQGKNIYVQNPFTSSGVGFCTAEVTINGETTTDEVNSSAFEVDFENFNLELGSRVRVEIIHKDDCKPKVLNPEVLQPRSTFVTVSIKVDKKTEELKWSTRNEIGKLPYIVEQKRWNKWVKVAEIEGNGEIQSNEYSLKVNTHSGANIFRVKQVDASGKARFSPIAKLTSTKPAVEFDQNKNEVTFDRATMYELYNQFGNIVRKGYGDSIDISGLPKGMYYLNFDARTEEFKK